MSGHGEHESHACIVAEIREHAPTKVKAYTALHRMGRNGPWYLSGLIYLDARKFDELRRRCAERCDREGDSYGAEIWSDAENIKIVPVELELPDGIEMIDLDTTSVVNIKGEQTHEHQ